MIKKWRLKFLFILLYLEGYGQNSEVSLSYSTVLRSHQKNEKLGKDYKVSLKI